MAAKSDFLLSVLLQNWEIEHFPGIPGFFFKDVLFTAVNCFSSFLARTKNVTAMSDFHSSVFRIK